jgi:hypothetical protein
MPRLRLGLFFIRPFDRLARRQLSGDMADSCSEVDSYDLMLGKTKNAGEFAPACCGD